MYTTVLSVANSQAVKQVGEKSDKLTVLLKRAGEIGHGLSGFILHNSYEVKLDLIKRSHKRVLDMRPVAYCWGEAKGGGRSIPLLFFYMYTSSLADLY